MTSLILGYGEIGKAVHAIIGEAGIVSLELNEDIPETVDILHVCFPYTKYFVANLQKYVEQYKPLQIIIYSTIPIGITRGFPSAVHSPIEGKHPDLELSIRVMERWIGCNKKEDGQFFVNFFRDLGIRTRLVENSDFTEALKLLSTTEYGVNLVFADYKARVAENIGMDFELTKEWNREYNKLYKNLGMDKRFQKFVLDAPGGKLGGHCVKENSRLLNKAFPDEMVKRIGDMQ